MMNFTPEQQLAVTTLDKNISVSAGAGSGKTRVLVERYVHILNTQNISCENILAITFTNKAAAEMKDRIRERLAEMAALAEEANAQLRWRRLKSALETAPISTIHGLCARVLRENPVEAGIDPNFAVADGSQTKLLLAEAVETAFAAALTKDEEWFGRLMLMLGKADLLQKTQRIYEAVSEDWLLDPDFWDKQLQLNAPDPESLLIARANLAQELEQLIALLPSLNPKNEHTLLVRTLAAHKDTVLSALARYPFDQDAQRCVEEILSPAIKRKEAKVDAEIIEEIKLQKNILLRMYWEKKALDYLNDLTQMLRLVDAEFTHIKSSRQILTFADMEVRTILLLRAYPHVREKYERRFQQIMVDEFQDTNEMQRDLIYLLAGGAPMQFSQPKLFIVGDPKQSIYRFRGADVSVFDAVTKDILSSGGQLVNLNRNFRSSRHILEVLNTAFSKLMGTPVDTVQFTPLEHHHETRAAEGCVELLKYIDGSAAERRVAEATAIAGRIRAMVDNGEQLVRDKQGDLCGTKFGDICLLIRTFTDTPLYEEALRKVGIPYYIVGARGFFDQQEIQDSLNLLRVIDNRHNEKALAGVLRSPFFLLNDETLLWLKAGKTSLWEGLEELDSISRISASQQQAAVAARKILRELRQQRGHVKTAELLETAIEHTGVDNIILTQFMGLQKFANLQKLVGLAREFQANCYNSVGDFIRYTESLAQDEKSEGNAQIESESGDTVKILTIHKSKGLEYPVVFIPDLCRQLIPSNKDGFIYQTGRGLGIKAPDTEDNVLPGFFAELLEEDKIAQQLEAKRLLYVAMTRAESYLVLPVAAMDSKQENFSLDKAKSFQHWLGCCLGIENFAALADRLVVDAVEIKVCEGEAAAVDARLPWGNSLLAAPTEIAFLPASLEQQLRSIASEPEDPLAQFSATALQRFRNCPRSFYYRYIEGLPELENRADAAAGNGTEAPANIVGTVVHRFCETYKPGVDAELCLDRAIWEAAPIEWRDQVRVAARPLIARYRNSRLYQELNALAPVAHEVSFEFCMDDPGKPPFWFYGKIDCLASYPDGSIGIIDFKTDRVEADGIPAKEEEYQWQAVLYALAVKACWNKPVRDFRLYLIRPDVTATVDISPEVLRKTAGEILAVCRFTREHRQESEYLCCASSCRFCGYQAICSQ